MEERSIIWYRMRGLGLTCLCSLVFFIGAYVANQRSVAVSASVNGREVPVCSVSTDKKQAALTFDADVADGAAQTILKILGKYDVKATFFLTGSWIAAHPAEVQQIAAEGHDIGSHSQSHRNMTELTKEEIQQEMEEVYNTVRELTGKEVTLFRAPYGAYNDEVIQTVKMSGCMPIQWNVDSQDWKNYGVDSILRMVTENERLENGSIILMHNGADYTAQALESVIAGLQSQGYELVPVSRMICWSDYAMDEGGRQLPGQSPAYSS